MVCHTIFVVSSLSHSESTPQIATRKVRNYSIFEQKVHDIFFWSVGSKNWFFTFLKWHPLLSLDD
jgi:hypothetical protein